MLGCPTPCWSKNWNFGFWLGQSLLNPLFLAGLMTTTAIVELQLLSLFHCLEVVDPTHPPPSGTFWSRDFTIFMIWTWHFVRRLIIIYNLTYLINTEFSFFSKEIFEQIDPLYRHFQHFLEVFTPWLLKTFIYKLKFSSHKPLVKKQNMGEWNQTSIFFFFCK